MDFELTPSLAFFMLMMELAQNPCISFEATCPPLSMALKSLAIYSCYSSRCEHALLEKLY
jgi:hypothetical protein